MFIDLFKLMLISLTANGKEDNRVRVRGSKNVFHMADTRFSLLEHVGSSWVGIRLRTLLILVLHSHTWIINPLHHCTLLITLLWCANKNLKMIIYFVTKISISRQTIQLLVSSLAPLVNHDFSYLSYLLRLGQTSSTPTFLYLVIVPEQKFLVIKGLSFSDVD